MTTIKSCTDISQSKKLTEILSFESADMYYASIPVREWKDKENTSKGIQVVFKDKIFAIENLRNHEIGEGDVYACSLTALLSVLPNYQLQTQDDGVVILCSCNGKFYIVTADNSIDACYEMILKLHKSNSL